MTIKSLFNLILKIMGLFLIKDIVIALPQLISVLFYIGNPGQFDEAIWTLLMSLSLIFCYVLIAWVLIFKSELIIEKLKLYNGFDQEIIPFNTHRSTILSISIIVVGILLMADEIPNMCRHLFSYFQEKRLTYGMTNPSHSLIVLSIAKALVGFVLVSNQRQIVNFIEKKRKD